MVKVGMTQKCIATRVVGNGNWEDFQWPHSGNRLDEMVHIMLQSLDLMEYSEVFKGEHFDDIAEMSDENLKNIGVKRFKHRKAIIGYISNQCKLSS